MIDELLERIAATCEERVQHPPGHRGQFEGYGPVTDTRSGDELAKMIREMIVADTDVEAIRGHLKHPALFFQEAFGTHHRRKPHGQEGA